MVKLSTEDKPEPSGHSCYIPHLDEINMPVQADFDAAENYYSTLAHEIIHGTLHESRLNRIAKGDSYAYEDLL